MATNAMTKRSERRETVSGFRTPIFVCAVALSLSACVPVATWNQFQGDAANTGQRLAASKPATSDDFTRLFVGQVYASPVFGFDGNLYVPTYSPDGSASGNAIVRISPNPMSILASSPVGGQLSTPAVDTDGNVYVAQYIQPNGPSKLIALDNHLKQRWSIDLIGEALSPPKLLVQSSGRELIFQEYIGGQPFGDHVLVTDTTGAVLSDQSQCLVVHGGSSIQFQLNGVRIGPPFAQRSALAAREFSSERGPQVYVVLAAGQCGVVFLRLDFTNGTRLIDFKGYVDDSRMYGTPIISNDGVVTVPISGESISAYRLTTGAKLWSYKSPAFSGALFPTAGISSYILSETYNAGVASSAVLKMDDATGHLDRQVNVLGEIGASPLSSGGYVFVATSSGLFTYDVDLNFVAGFSLPAGAGSPALSADGDLFVHSTDGYLYRFPGFASR